MTLEQIYEKIESQRIDKLNILNEKNNEINKLINYQRKEFIKRNRINDILVSGRMKTNNDLNDYLDDYVNDYFE